MQTFRIVEAGPGDLADVAALFRAYAGDDPQTQQNIREANQREPSLMQGTWVDEDLLHYLGQAVAALQD